MSARRQLGSRERRRLRRAGGVVTITIRGDKTYSKTWQTPEAGAAIAALEAGVMPSDQQLRAGLRQLRHIRDEVVRRGAPGANTEAIEQLEDWIDVLDWCLDQPIEQQPRRCATCQRRPARFDDLCKRCAEAAGIRPRGKIT